MYLTNPNKDALVLLSSDEAKRLIFDAVVETLMESFSDAQVDGVVIYESQACLVAGEVLARLHLDADDPP